MNLNCRVLVSFLLDVGLCFIFGCGGTGGPNSPTGVTPAVRGQQIVDEFLKRDSSPYRKDRIRFTVTDEDKTQKVYEIETWRKQTSDETVTLNDLVAAPSGEEGGRSLTIEGKGKKTVVVTYAASRDEFRETDSKKMFFGGLTVGELLGDWDKFDYQFIGEKDLNGVKVYEVEGRLKAGADSLVSRMNVLFRADNYIPAESNLFGADRNEIRTYKTGAVKDDPTHPYASRVEVDNPVYKSHIVIEILIREFPETIDDAMFAREKLKEAVKKPS
jgi:hypothetical protein